MYRQVENVMARYPKLRTSMAHLYFTSDDRAHAERVLNAHPDFWLDLTPGSEMYHAFLADPEGWRAFFETYQDRLVFGTDMEDTDGDVVFSSQDAMVALVIRVLWIGRQASHDYGFYLCVGVAAILIAQTVENVGMCLGLLPVVGITLPFLSCGGSSLLATFILVGMVHSVSSHKPVRRIRE
jgi:uncharacterized protein YeaO (DUF488 family)